MQNSKSNRLIGLVYRNTEQCGKLLSITYPEDCPQIVVVDSKILGKANSFDIYGNNFIIFAEEEILYPNQPLFAAFGPSLEEVELFFRKVKVDIEASESSIDPQKKTFEWSSGEIQEIKDENTTVVSSEFAIKRFSANLSSDRKVQSVYSDDTLTVTLGTLWPKNVKDVLAESLNLSPEKINIVTQEAHYTFDQLAFKPLILAIPSSYVALNKNCPVEISEDISSSHPALRYDIESVVNKETSEIIQTKAKVSADIGAYFVFEQELAISLAAGLVGLYKNKAITINVEVFKTNNMPSNFFNGLGYAPSLAALEHHVNIVANTLGIQPDKWKMDNVADTDNPDYTTIFDISDIERLRKTIPLTSQEASFQRKNSIYNQKHISGHTNPALNYTRGIGIASGGGVSGFSSQLRKHRQYQLSAVLTENNDFILHCGIYANEGTKNLWKSVIKETFPEIPLRNIIIKDIGPDVTDLGPSILSRSTSIIPNLLEKLCIQIKNKRDAKESYPIFASFNTIAESNQNALYKVNSFGTLVIDLYIDPVKLIPVVYYVIADFSYGKIRNKEQQKKELRQIITQTIRDICPDASIDYNLKMQLEENPQYESDYSISLARGLTTAALSIALSQALRHNIYRLPVLSKDILGIIRQKEAKLNDPQV